MAVSPADDTEALVVQAQGGDRTALSQLLERHRNRLRRMVEVRLDRRVAARLDPSDIVQETLAEASQKLSDYLRDRPVAFYPWLRRLAWENLVRMHERHLKAARRSATREDHRALSLPDESAMILADQLVASGLAPDRRLIEAELKARVEQALGGLPERDREILILRYLEQLSNRDIAEILELNEGAVRTRLTRALDRLTGLIESTDSEHQA